MKKYVATVIKASEDHVATHTDGTEARKQVIKSSDPKDPVIRLLEATHWVVRTQAERAIDAFLKKIMETLHKHIPVTCPGSPNSKHPEH